MSQIGTAPLLELKGISKSFGAVLANRDVDLVLGAGEVLGLLGENGAGKTTLMNILFGLYTPDGGRILLDGQEVELRGPADALSLGIGMVHQHFHLVPRHSVLENLMIGHPGVRLDRAETRRRLAAIGDSYGLRLDPEDLVSALSVGEQQRLEIIKALYHGARVLILDEPTSVLTPQESAGLFAAIRAMAADGVGVIFISHKLREVREITDRIAVLRRGEKVAEHANGPDTTNRELAELMCGHELSPPQKRPTTPGQVLLELSAVSTRRAAGRPTELRDVSLSLRAGEIVGLAGVSGNGQRELADLIAGILPPAAGHLMVAGQTIAHPSPARLRARRVASVPEDRVGEGLLGGLPLTDSFMVPHIGARAFSRWGWLKPRAIRDFVAGQIADYDIRVPGQDVATGTMSGGNQQKALIARELALDPLVLVVAQPTRGLDVAAREFVHGLFLELRDKGRCVLVISEDLDELFEITDRLAVIYEGRLVAELPTAEAEVSRIGLLMAGAAGAAEAA